MPLQGWLGGWLLPQEKSYFAIRLPQGWWVFGLDLALGHDIDVHQYRCELNELLQRRHRFIVFHACTVPWYMCMPDEGRWVFGLDPALGHYIDVHQYRCETRDLV